MKVKSNYARSLVVGLLAMIMLLIGFCVMPVNRTETAKADLLCNLEVRNYNGENCVYIGNVPNTDSDQWGVYELEKITLVVKCPDLTVKKVDCSAYYLSSKGFCVPFKALFDVAILGDYYVGAEIVYLNPSEGIMQEFISISLKVKNGNIINLPTPPEKEGYTFVEWCLDEALTIVYDGREITEDLKLYAKFKINTYTVTFNSNGGTTVAIQTLDYNTIATLTRPTRVGYDFIGWFIGETQYIDGAIKADTTLVAKWKIQTFKVTFMVGNEVYKELTVDYGTTLVKALQVANMAYYSAVNASGEKLDSSEKIVGDTTLSVVEMTKEEKVATFLSKNIWILWTAGISIVVLIMLVSVLVSKTKK